MDKFKAGKMRKYIDRTTAEKMINATMPYRLDYSNILLYEVKQSHIDRLQRCQNSATTII